MSKFCILNSDKICNNCGECDICDLDSNKKCNNCGKCLQIEGYDAKAINIEEILESSEDDSCIEDYDDINKNPKNVSSVNIEDFADKNKDFKEEDIHIEYIDDVDGLSELLQEKNAGSSSMEELFPGFMVFNKK